MANRRTGRRCGLYPDLAHPLRRSTRPIRRAVFWARSPTVPNPNPLLPPVATAGREPDRGLGLCSGQHLRRGGLDHTGDDLLPHRASTTRQKASLAQARALLNGDFGASSPWAEDPIGFAVGGEYRRYRGSQSADSCRDVGRARRRRRRRAELQWRLQGLGRLWRVDCAAGPAQAGLRESDPRSGHPLFGLHGRGADLAELQHDHLEAGGHLGAVARPPASAAITSARSVPPTSTSCSRRPSSA